MADEPPRKLARLDKRELFDLPAQWSDRERGQYLRLLLRGKGIDPDRLYRLEYFPYRHCWLLTQDVPARAPGATDALPPGPPDDHFYQQAMTEFRRIALSAFSAAAAHSRHLAQYGRKYELPETPQEITPAGLIQLLGGVRRPAVQFTSEGGWQNRPSEN